MTDHLHSTHVPGCYRCDLREDEARDHAAAEWDDLARLAEAATPAPWLIRDEGQEVYTTALSDDLADTVAETLDTHDAEFIAAANPATILRLIAENRDLSERLVQAYRDVVLAHDGRDALAARLAAVEALHTPQPGQGPACCQDCDQRWPCPTRAVLSAAPINTTKETS